MTVTADNKRRVVLPNAKPGDLFEVQFAGPGKVTLTKLEPVKDKPANARLEKRGGFTVLVSDQPVSQAAIDEALADFP
jgi:hypothetical protein